MTLLGGIIPDLGTLGISPVVLAVAITTGWPVTGASSPFTATTILLGQISQTSAATTGARWNGLYAVIGLILISFYVIGLAFLL